MSRSADPRARLAAGATVLTLATYLWTGYQYETWPQPGLLTYVLRIDGQLRGDWAADGPPLHWFVSHVLGVLPFGAVEPAVGVLWVVSLLVLWSGWLLLGDALGLDWGTSLAAGLVAIPTAMAGFGTSSLLFGYFYPLGTAFALMILALALLLRGRPLGAGACAGLGLLVHPGVGVLFAFALLVVAWWAAEDRAGLVRFVVPLALVGGPGLIQSAVGQALGSQLSAQRRFELLAEIRLPHHFLYQAFPLTEYVTTGLWVALAALLVPTALRGRTPVRGLLIAAGAAGAMCLAGAAASLAHWPVTLIELATPRVSPMLVVAGVFAGAFLIQRVAGRHAPLILLGALLAGDLLDVPLREQVAAHAPKLANSVNASSIEAFALLATLAVARLTRPPVPRTVARLGLAGAAIGVAAVFVHQRASLHFDSLQDRSLRAVAGEVRRQTPPGATVLVPPGADNFTLYARRGAVVTFGGFRFGRGDAEWARRLVDVTGDPAVVSVQPLGHDVSRREAVATADYLRQLRRSRAALCRYRAAGAVAYRTTRYPPWLRVVYRNAVYSYAVRADPATCATSPAPVR